jgi:hypothetical protein
MRWQDVDLEIDEAASKQTSCDCCSKVTTHIEGFLSANGNHRGWHTVRLSEDVTNHQPLITIYVGDFSEGAPKDRKCGARTIWKTEGCELLDWEDSAITSFTPLRRRDILGFEFEPEFWGLVDAVIMKDPRLEPLHT